MHKIELQIGAHPYPIYVGSGAVAQLADWLAAQQFSQLVVISDEHVAAEHLGALKAALSTYKLAEFVVTPGENSKSFDQLEQLLRWMAQQPCDRQTLVVALGGGVVGDLAGFAASVYQRGIAYLQLPSSLLAQVDSSVGGKTAINLPEGKNLVGSFHQPAAVFADLDFLKSLPEREYRSGLAECIKAAILAGDEHLDYLEGQLDALLARDVAVLEKTVVHAVTFKAAVVARDEREAGPRAWLNLGHTFAHAIEKLGDYQRHTHGEAVAIGLLAALRISAEAHGYPAAVVEQVQRLMRRLDLPAECPYPAAAMHDAMLGDKKSQAGELRFTLMKGIGEATVTAPLDAAASLALVQRALAT